MSEHSRLNQAILNTCPDLGEPVTSARIQQRLLEISRQHRLHAHCLQVVPVGSFCEATTTTESSGLDILCVLEGGKFSQFTFLVQNALAPEKCVRSRHALLFKDPTLGNYALYPSTILEPGSFGIYDYRNQQWVVTLIGSHQEEIHKSGPIGAAVIRFVKLWNSEQVEKLESYHIDAIAIDTFAGEVQLDFHTSLKLFFDKAVGVIGRSASHPLDVAVIFDMSSGARSAVLTQLVEAQDNANKAWFLEEFEHGQAPAGPIGFYVKLLRRG